MAEWLGVAVLVVGIKPLYLGVEHRALWVFKAGLVCIVAGLLHFFALSELSSTLPFCLKLPFYPIFSEIQKAKIGPMWNSFPGLVFFYNSVIAWSIEHVGPHGGAVRDVIDHVVTLLMWFAIVFAMSFLSNSVTIVQSTKRDYFLLPVLFSFVPAYLARFVDVPSHVDSWVSAASFLLHLYALHAMVTFLAAAQADEDGRNMWASWELKWGILPWVEWKSKES